MADVKQENDDANPTLRRRKFKKTEEEQMKTDVCQWLKETLGRTDITPKTFFETLETGVVLCQLVDKIQEKARALKDTGKQVHCKIPLDPVSYHVDAQKNPFHAQENIKYFISWCRSLGVKDECIFDTSDLVQHKHERTILLCLLEVSRYYKKLTDPVGVISEEETATIAKNEPLEEAEKVIDKAADDSTKNCSLSEPVFDNEPPDHVTNPPNEPPPQPPVEHQLPDHKSKGTPPIKPPPDDNEGTSYSSFRRDYCSYRFLFFLLLLLLLLGIGFFL